jgi:hypothetical protein
MKCEVVDWIYLPQDRDQNRIFAKSIVKFGVQIMPIG